MFPEGLDHRYDRRADEEFLRLFAARGMLSGVTEYARKAPYPVDLQFRRNPKSGDQRASVYVGLTSVLDIHWRPPGQVKLAARDNLQTWGFDSAWVDWSPLDAAAAWVGGVEDYLDVVIPAASSSGAAVEGAVQAAVSSFASDSQVMVDREAQPHFRDMATRASVMQEVGADLLGVLESAPVPGKRPGSFGWECDLLAVDRLGRLRAVEVKPRGASTITWAPAQAIVYARVFARWLAQDPEAADIVNGMAAQRSRLGLASAQVPTLLPGAEVVPVVAVQRGMSGEQRQRLFAVADHLEAHGIKEAAALEICEVNLAGRLVRAR